MSRGLTKCRLGRVGLSWHRVPRWESCELLRAGSVAILGVPPVSGTSTAGGGVPASAVLLALVLADGLAATTVAPTTPSTPASATPATSPAARVVATGGGHVATNFCVVENLALVQGAIMAIKLAILLHCTFSDVSDLLEHSVTLSNCSPRSGVGRLVTPLQVSIIRNFIQTENRDRFVVLRALLRGRNFSAPVFSLKDLSSHLSVLLIPHFNPENFGASIF